MNASLCNMLDDFLDDELAHGERQVFARHLRFCGACDRAVTQTRKIQTLLKVASVRARENFSPQDASLTFASTCEIDFRHRRSVFAAVAIAASLLIGAALSLASLLPRSEHVANQQEAAQRPAGALRSRPDIPRASVQFADDAKLLAVTMPTRHDDVTIVWTYPTVE